MTGLIVRAILIIGAMVVIPISAGVLYSSTQEVDTNAQPTRIISVDAMGITGGLNSSANVVKKSTQNDTLKTDDNDGKITDNAARIDKTVRTE